MVIQWNRNLFAGIDEIDTRHEELFSKMDGLFTAMSQGRGEGEVSSIMRFLADFIEVHFSSEEKYMVEHGYPAYRSHKQEHAEFINNFSYLKREYETEGISTFLVLKIERLLCDWMAHHIGKADRALWEFLKAKP
jgi:hemerythrin